MQNNPSFSHWCAVSRLFALLSSYIDRGGSLRSPFFSVDLFICSCANTTDFYYYYNDFIPDLIPWWLRWWRICLQWRRPGFDPWVTKIRWRREYPLQSSCLENSMDRGARWATVHGVAKSDWAINTFTLLFCRKVYPLIPPPSFLSWLSSSCTFHYCM